MPDPTRNNTNDASAPDAFEIGLDKLLAGELSSAKSEAFIAGLTHEQREVLDQEREVKSHLSAMFEAPEAVMPKPAPPKTLKLRPIWVFAAVAAALAVVGTIELLRPDPAPIYRGPGVYDRYAAAIEADFQPDWVCETDEQFAEALEDHFGSAFVVERVPDLEVVGWMTPLKGYGGGENAPPLDLLLRVGGEPVVVVIATRNRNPKPDQESSDGLRVRSRTFGMFYLYQVSGPETPNVLSKIRRSRF